ncbi:hypothetical protein YASMINEVIRUS_544 [Yasminevirus sp. GU-2018]|uniref:PNPLA domain-containing protein n=1 Tax=Yasminevirus sp. GU-2018 TaxID=2420051 RepID=A0A5K0U958_9VIRU|nr:hypothetical protein YASMINEVIRUS_544 [Yasminevirus sp. GU-2018]
MSDKQQTDKNYNSVGITSGTKSDTSTKTVEGPCDTGIKNVVVGGGGVWIYAYAGAIDDMFSDDDIQNLKNLIGSSAGAIVAMLLSCGVDKKYIRDTINSFDLNIVQDHSRFNLVNAYRIIKYFGYNKGDAILNWIGDVLEELTGNRDITFAEHYAKYKKNLIVTGCNVSRNTFRYFNRLNDSEMKVAEAVRISMSIPFFFRPFEYGGDLYIDGGTTLNYPFAFTTTDLFKLLNNYDPEIVGPTDSTKRVNLDVATRNIYDMTIDTDSSDPVYQAFILNRTVGVKTFSKRSLNYIRQGRTAEPDRNFNIVSYIESIVSMGIDAILREYVDDNMWARTIRIDSSAYGFADFNLSKEDGRKMFLIGKNSARSFRGLPPVPLNDPPALVRQRATVKEDCVITANDFVNSNTKVSLPKIVRTSDTSVRSLYAPSLSSVIEEPSYFSYSKSKQYDPSDIISTDTSTNPYTNTTSNTTNTTESQALYAYSTALMMQDMTQNSSNDFNHNNESNYDSGLDVGTGDSSAGNSGGDCDGGGGGDC